MKYLLTILIINFCLPTNSLGQAKKGKTFQARGMASGKHTIGNLVIKKDGTFELSQIIFVEGMTQGPPREYYGTYVAENKLLQLNVKSINLKYEQKTVENDGLKIRSRQPVYGNFPTDNMPIASRYRIFNKIKAIYLMDVNKLKTKKEFDNKKEWWNYIKNHSIRLDKGTYF